MTGSRAVDVTITTVVLGDVWAPAGFVTEAKTARCMSERDVDGDAMAWLGYSIAQAVHGIPWTIRGLGVRFGMPE